MLINELLSVLDLSNINIFKINGQPLPFIVLKDMYSDYKCDGVQIKTKLENMTEQDIIYDIDTQHNYVEALVTVQLPNAPAYISIELNFIIKGDIDHG